MELHLRRACLGLWALLLVVPVGCGSSPGPADGGADGAAPIAEDLARPPDLAPSLQRPFDWTGVVGTGQSLSVGVQGAPVISTTQPFANLKFSEPNFSGDLSGAPSAGAALVPLIEPIRTQDPRFPAPPAYPNNIYGESPHAAMAAELSTLAQRFDGRDYTTFHSVIGESGQSITVIRKGGTGNSYAAALYEARAAAALARQAGKTFGYGAITLTHGESDWNRATYAADIYQLLRDYNADLKAITGQRQPIPMLLSQQGTFPNLVGSAPSTLAEWKLGVDHPGEILCVGPKYQYEYAADHVHLTANAYRRLGQKYAQVYFQAVVRGQPWAPLQPLSVQRGASQLTVKFSVPVPPLQWDARLPAPHQTLNQQWAPGRGFEVSDATGPIGITAVTLSLPDQVVIALARAPGADLQLAYGMTQDVAGYTGGTANARGGQLRDSDSSVGYDQETVACNVTSGSAVVTAVSAGGLSRRSLRDVVAGTALADDTTIATRTSSSQVTLSAPWTGASGVAMLTFRNDLHNYAVQFSMPVP